MGAYLSQPVTKTEPEEGEGRGLKYGASSMQGWRVSQEDAHNCVLDFDVNSSLFAVYDGHGGSEVAIYLSQHLPEFLKNSEAYKNGNMKEALVETYLRIDESIKTPDVLKEILRIAKCERSPTENDGHEEENVNELYEEATMPIEKLVAKYREGKLLFEKLMAKKVSNHDSEKPGSSKHMGIDLELTPVEASETSSAVQPIPDEAVSTISEGNVKISFLSASTSTGSHHLISEELNEQISNKPSIEDADFAKNGSIDDVHEGSPEEEPIVLPNTNLPDLNHDKERDKDENSKCDQIISNGIAENSEDNNEEGSHGSDNREESILVEPKKRKGKTHPPPIFMSPKPEPIRKSPRENSKKVYLDFLKGETDSTSEESEDDGEDVAFEESDSEEDDGSEEAEKGDSSSDMDDNDGDAILDDEDESEDDEALKDFQEPGYDSGATAVTAFLRWENGKLHLWVANAGDSRCVVSRKGDAVEMSEDHKPEDEREALRIVNAGGKVTCEGRVNGGLNLSRALGDHSYKSNRSLPLQEQMITPLPDIEYLEVNPETDNFIILACDGIWNSMTSQQVVDFVNERISNPEKKLSGICDELFHACMSPDTSGDGTGCDNMTAIIVKITKEANQDWLPPNTSLSMKETEVATEMETNSCSNSSDEDGGATVPCSMKRSLNGTPELSPTASSSDVKRIKLDIEGCSENPRSSPIATTANDESAPTP